MPAWDDGYVSDLGYTHGYYAELNPLRVRLAFLAAGLRPPDIRRACELGFGQGMSINLHAAAGSARWFGTDFNPGQAAFAAMLAEAGGSDAKLFDDAFADFADRDDLPAFDFIGLHGIWSWISRSNRDAITRLIRKRLALGGVVYVSYNILPGWSANAPLRHILAEHDRVLGHPGRNRKANVDAAIDFAETVLAAAPAILRASPGLGERLKHIRGQSRSYLAHEYFNRDWEPVYFRDMADCLEPAKLSFAGSAHPIDQIEAINLTAEQLKVMAQLADPVMREGLRDVMTGSQFRRDYWARGTIRLTGPDLVAAWSDLRLVMVQPRTDVGYAVSTSLGEANLSESIYTPLFDLMADHKPRRFSAILAEVSGHGMTVANLREAVLLLVGNGTFMPVQDDGEIDGARASSSAINDAIMARAHHSADIAHLASPVTGGGFPVRRFHQIFLSLLKTGVPTGDLASGAWSILKANGERLAKDGKPIADDAGNMAELAVHAGEFRDKWLPLYRSLQLV